MAQEHLGPTSSPVSRAPVMKIFIFNTILHQREPGLHAGQLTPRGGEVKTPEHPVVAKKQYYHDILSSAYFMVCKAFKKNQYSILF